jgi:hypothetical protein
MPVSNWLVLLLWAGPCSVGVLIFILSESDGRLVMAVKSRNLGSGLVVVIGTMLWAVPLLVLMGFALAKNKHHTNRFISYDEHFYIKIIGSGIMICIGIFTICYAYKVSQINANKWSSYPIITILVLYWALFPPMWFFTEYFAFACNFIHHPPEIPDKEFLSNLRDYAGLAAPVWAGFGAIFAGLLSQIK